MTGGEILVVPFFGQGHLFPSMELCKHLASRNFKATLIISSNLTSSIPSSLRQHPLVEIAEISASPPMPPPQQPSPESDPLRQHHRHHQQMAIGLEGLLSTRSGTQGSTRPICAVLDVMMGWSSEIFHKLEVPTVGFFTSGACAEAMEYAAWKAHVEDIQPGEVRLVPGLPEDMALTYSDLKRRPHGPPHLQGGGGGGGPPGAGGPGGPPGFARPPGGGGPRKFGPPRPGEQPPWVNEVEGAIALIINTCDDLERPFIDYVGHQIGVPVWGVGPLLPEEYWKSADSILRDREFRPNRQSNYSEDEVIEWLDSKPRGSVIYVSFGSEVGPSMEEYPKLAAGLEESDRPFVWVIQRRSSEPGRDQPDSEGYFPHGLDSKVGKRGLIIHGWAPQLLILSHPSTGGFVSHCGWNSTVEAIVRGVPFMAWPIRGDQYYNAKLVVSHLKVGIMVSDGYPADMVKKEDIIKGIEKLVTNEEVKNRAAALRGKFEHGFPASSVASLDAFADFINQNSC
ncbi:hypothetical protein L1049_003596 [Liquidambar formosana]|uniref:Glycosyltransferase n=1 Tax=Liquidambar formosana TaxID=63359 RepID=A0AAP0N5R1_LIQFO